MTKAKSLPYILSEALKPLGEHLNPVKIKYEMLVEFYNSSLDKLEEEAKGLDKVFNETLKAKRAELSFTYTVEFGTHNDRTSYKVKRTCDNPIEGDSKYCEDRKYCDFKIINNVLIVYGGGYVLNAESGDIIYNHEIEALDRGDVPKWLVDKNETRVLI